MLQFDIHSPFHFRFMFRGNNLLPPCGLEDTLQDDWDQFPLQADRWQHCACVSYLIITTEEEEAAAEDEEEEEDSVEDV